MAWVLGVALVALLPDPGAALPTATYYFRDFTQTFYPLRHFQATELAAGRLPFWNPFVHEGEFMLPSFYPSDLLHVLNPRPEFVSWLLTMHLPLAALGAYALGRVRGLSRLGAFVCGAVYAIGGFALSSVNLYSFLQALALAPFLVLALERAASRGGRWIGVAALAVALGLTTLAVEIIAQAIALGAALAWWRDLPAGETPVAARPALARVAAALALGIGLAAIPVAVTLGVLPETERGAGLAPDESGSLALPPLALLQAFVPNLFGLLGRPLEAWWGGRIFADGTPYFLSIYFGVPVLALAVAGAALAPRRERAVLLAAATFGIWYALGPAGGLWNLLQELPLVSAFRTPSKTVFLVHFAAALLAGRGIDRLGKGDGWSGFSLASATGVLIAGGIGALAWLAHDSVVDWLQIDAVTGEILAAVLPADAARSALIGSLGVGLALAVRLRHLQARPAVTVLALVVATDLAVAGTGLNRQTEPVYFEPLPGIAAARLDEPDAGRTFVYPAVLSRNFLAWLDAQRPDSGLWTYFALRQQLDPYSNLLDRVETAGSQDRTRFSPQLSQLGWTGYDPRDISQILPFLRHAAVASLLSFDPLTHPQLRLRAVVPVALTGLAIHQYDLDGPWPRALVACNVRAAATRLEAARAPHASTWDPQRDLALEGAANPPQPGCTAGNVRRQMLAPGEERYGVESDGPGWLLVRSTHARGWTAAVDGLPAPVLRADGRHRAVAIPAGRHEVKLRYDPPGLLFGAAATLVSVLILSWLLARRR
ncbi:MAG: hypothetical protein EPO27_02470 [Betaproteobacteria bacterium]|nr:MAG: hypothetical protein EPO27_02470 [Betaproteobacteria bacterium]